MHYPGAWPRTAGGQGRTSRAVRDGATGKSGYAYPQPADYCWFDPATINVPVQWNDNYIQAEVGDVIGTTTIHYAMTCSAWSDDLGSVATSLDTNAESAGLDGVCKTNLEGVGIKIADYIGSESIPCDQDSVERPFVLTGETHR
jgi:hypothetical protein